MKKFNTLLSNFLEYYTPSSSFQSRLNEILFEAKKNSDIVERAEYYCRLKSDKLGDKAISIDDYRFPYLKKHRYAFYFFDLYRVLKYFPHDYRFNYLFGDIIHEPEHPTFVKSREISGSPTNSVILKWDSLRHFNFITDNLRFSDKRPVCVMRNLWANEKRARFLNKFLHDPMFDLGIIQPSEDHPEWNRGYLSITEQLQNRYVVCIEGNDVATNLKWVMSSNSLAVMPEPVYETWYMEGRLIPDRHYIKVADDYSDVIDKLNYYDRHPAEVQKILDAQHAWVEKFTNNKIELMTEILVANRYFSQTS